MPKENAMSDIYCQLIPNDDPNQPFYEIVPRIGAFEISFNGVVRNIINIWIFLNDPNIFDLYSFCSQKCFPKCGLMQLLLPINAIEPPEPSMADKIWCNFKLQDNASDSQEQVVVNNNKRCRHKITHKKYNNSHRLQHNKNNQCRN